LILNTYGCVLHQHHPLVEHKYLPFNCPGELSCLFVIKESTA
jgi:hypothetical protein